MRSHDILRLFYDLGLYAYLVATILLAVRFFWRRRWLLIAGLSVLGLGLAMQIAHMAVSWGVAGRPPFANTFETLVLLAACLVAFFLPMTRNKDWLGVAPLVAFAALMITVYANLIMPDEFKPLLPSLLNSYWLTVHVVICIVSYAGFIMAYISALGYLAREPKHAKGAALAFALSITGTVAASVFLIVGRAVGWGESRLSALALTFGAALVSALGLWPLTGIVDRKLGLRERLPDKEALARMTYKSVSLGFPFLTAGIITGSIWAHQVFGHYWVWDPKETASLVTCLVFALYLHLRLVPKWRGPWIAWVAVAGFWCVLFTFFGVNLIGGYHAFYAS